MPRGFTYSQTVYTVFWLKEDCSRVCQVLFKCLSHFQISSENNSTCTNLAGRLAGELPSPTLPSQALKCSFWTYWSITRRHFKCIEVLAWFPLCKHIQIFTVHKRSCGKVMFLHLPVSQSVHGGVVCLSTCWDTHPPWADIPLGRHPPGQTPSLGRHPFWADTPHWPVHAGIDMAYWCG